MSEDRWTKLQPSKYFLFGLAIVDGKLTTIGGGDYDYSINTLLTLSTENEWKEVLPPMPTSRTYPAVATTPTHLVVAGGLKDLYHESVPAVEVLNTDTLQWSTASSSPHAFGYPKITLCGGSLYLSQDCFIFFCSVDDLLKSCNSGDGGSVWTRLEDIPTPRDSTLATLRGCVLAIAGNGTDDPLDKLPLPLMGGNGFPYTPSGAIHCYDVATNSWSAIGELPAPRSQVLAAVFPSNELVVVGGKVGNGHKLCSTNEIFTGF